MHIIIYVKKIITHKYNTLLKTVLTKLDGAICGHCGLFTIGSAIAKVCRDRESVASLLPHKLLNLGCLLSALTLGSFLMKSLPQAVL
jgi:hypothetical protein